MTSKRDPLSPASWKEEVKPTQAKRGGGPHWRREPLLPSRWSRQRLRLMLASLLGLLLLVGFVLFLWVASWLWPVRSVHLVLAGAGYEDNLAFPHNVYGMNVLRGLAEVVQSQPAVPFREAGILRLSEGPRRLHIRDAWDQDLDQGRDRTVVLFLALHGGSDRQGAYLVPEDADTRDAPENCLRLDQVLDRLARLPANQNKVLFLEATQMTANWSLGLLQNDFDRALDNLGARIAAIPNLVVISATAPGQQSWTSDEWRQTVFGHLLIEGLKGATSDIDRDSRISLWELFQYVGPGVTNWVWSNRQALQTPVLLPRGAEGERRARSIEMILSQPYSAPDLQQVPDLKKAGLDKAWERHHELADQVPSPVVYSPSLWRRYRDTLLRYEQLIIAGAPEPAGRLRTQLEELELEISRARRVGLGSLQNSLAMPAVDGLVVPPLQPQGVVQFSKLWNASPQNRAKEWDQVQRGAGDRVGQQVQRLQFLRHLLDRVEEEPSANLAEAAQLARILAAPAIPNPVEIHYLLLLQRDLPQVRPSADLLRQAVRAMRQGEQAALGATGDIYPYSEEVYPWIGAGVTSADQQRRAGQDLLLASSTESWKKAETSFQQAKEGYTRALADATRVREALHLRQRVLAALPYYSHWQARRGQPGARQSQAEAANQLRDLEELWRNTHTLTGLLEKGPNGDKANKDDTAQMKNLAAQTELVQRPFDNLVNRFQDVCLKLTDVNLPIAWRDIDDVLVVPDLDPGVRLQLLRKRQRISRELLIEAAQARSPLPSLDDREWEEQARGAARVEGRLALAVLGRAWFDQCVAAGQEDYTQTQRRLETFASESRWWEALEQVGERIGLCWQRMPQEINRQVQRSSVAERAGSLAALQGASRLARLLDGCGSKQVKGRPAVDLRRFYLQDVLAGQARRSWEDHWFAEDPARIPYYQAAGLLYLDDARLLDSQQRAPTPSHQALREQLNQPGTLVFAGRTRLEVTSEQRLRLDYQVQPAPEANVPPGYPVIWVEGSKLLDLLAPTGDIRLVRQIGADRMSAAIRCELGNSRAAQDESEPPTVPEVNSTTVRLRGLYRGQQIDQQTRVNLYPLPDNIWYQTPQPTRGHVAVRAAREIQGRFGTSSGNVAIVLDCSGSMGPPAGQAYGPTTKYAEALRALRQVLNGLPKGITVSLWVFGQAMGPRKTEAEAERTVTRLQEPIVWDPADTNQLANLMTKVEYPAVEPWNESPIVRAIVSARDDLANATGFKTILVLTDGMDNRFANDRELNPDKLSIPVYLTQVFRTSGIVINMIGYKVVDEEQKQAETQFKFIEKLPLPGKYVTVNDTSLLAETLEQAFRRFLRYQIDYGDNVPVLGPPGGVDVSLLGANNQWFPGGLEPGTYKLRVFTNQQLGKDISIGRGDLLLVDLVPSESGPAFARGSFARAEYPGSPRQDRADWCLGVLQNQALAGGGLQMLLTLEKKYDPREDILQMLKPRQMWLEVQPAAVTATPYCQRWGYQSGYPAAAWNLEVPAWPATITPARPAVRAWWNPDQELAPASSLDRGADFQTPADIVNRSLVVEGDEVRLSGVTVEEHIVQTGPGLREKKSCLVVRLEHAPQRPVWVRLRGLNLAGQEHRFYLQAGQYTGLFWPVTRQEADQVLLGLDLFSVAAFKRDAERRGYTIEMTNLAAPEANSVRPRPPVTARMP